MRQHCAFRRRIAACARPEPGASCRLHMQSAYSSICYVSYGAYSSTRCVGTKHSKNSSTCCVCPATKIRTRLSLSDRAAHAAVNGFTVARLHTCTHGIREQRRTGAGEKRGRRLSELLGADLCSASGKSATHIADLKCNRHCRSQTHSAETTSTLPHHRFREISAPFAPAFSCLLLFRSANGGASYKRVSALTLEQDFVLGLDEGLAEAVATLDGGYARLKEDRRRDQNARLRKLVLRHLSPHLQIPEVLLVPASGSL